ncbi:MAG: ABC transporter permease, partial [Gemmatimonadota bacterium]
MRTAARILGYEIRNLIRSRWVLAYALIFLALTDVLFRFGGTSDRVIMSLTNVVLLLIPLVSVVLGTMHLYHAREFIELLLAQPVGRRTLFAGLYGGLALPLAAAFVVGAGLPFLYTGAVASDP